LSYSVTLQRLESICRWYAQIVEIGGGVQEIQLAQRMLVIPSVELAE
jgi:hypothetical protein